MLAPRRAFLEGLIAQDPDITLFELRDALAEAEGVKSHHSSIAKLLSQLGFTYKKSCWSPPSAVAPRLGGNGLIGSGITCPPSNPCQIALSSLLLGTLHAQCPASQSTKPQLRRT
jgi:hypothetical protein